MALTSRTGRSLAGFVLFALLLYSALLWLGKRLMAADSLQGVHSILHLEGPIMLAVVFLGLAASMQLQRVVRAKRRYKNRHDIKKEPPADEPSAK